MNKNNSSKREKRKFLKGLGRPSTAGATVLVIGHNSVVPQNFSSSG